MRAAILSLCLVFCVTLGGASPARAHGESQDARPPVPGVEKREARTNPRSTVWRLAREGQAGVTADPGPESGVLIENRGQLWRRLRNGPLATGSAFALLGVLAALTGFFAWRGPVRLSEPRTGHTLLRWSAGERVLHWAVAGAFIVLGLSGLVLLYGREALIPWLGHAVFAELAAFAKLAHNSVGPVIFLPGLLLMIVLWARDNWPKRVDLAWFRAWGGLVGHAHPSAGRMNGGEKAWFWLLTLAGAAVCVSGVLLDFPSLAPLRADLQIAHLTHAAAALALLAGSLGHAYIGSIGSEGALEGMTRGTVDESWARQHHDLWLEDLGGGRLRQGPENH